MDERTKYNIELIQALDELIAEGQWEGGLFFQASGKKLRDLSERLKKELQIDIDKKATPTELVNYIKQHSGLVEIYISLYSAEGNNLRQWEVVLSNLPKQMISRQIYKKEKDIKATIAARENTINDAYAIAYVNEMDILKPSFQHKIPVNRYGHELLIIKENVLKIENITKLIHSSGEYSYQKGHLIKLSSN